MTIPGDDNGDDFRRRRFRDFWFRLNQWNQWKEWLLNFFSEVYKTKITFWDQPASTTSNNVVLTGFGFFAIHFARSTYGAYAWSDSSVVLLFLLVAVFSMAYGICLLDLAFRTSLADYQKNAKECRRVLWIGVLLSA